MAISRSINNFSDLSLHESCQSCEKIGQLEFCSMYLEPKKQWTRLGGCAGRTHGKVLKDIRPKGFVDPLKASKRQSKGRIDVEGAVYKKPAKKKKVYERRDSR